tara:strand:- start:3010 stop:3930 length:921 start_codon:yes stop_codon:yes gene_type:complete
MTIKKVLIPNAVINSIPEVFENEIIKCCFNENMWVAGGFARHIGNIVLIQNNSCLNARSYLSNYFHINNNNNGDIDFFTDNTMNVEFIKRKFCYIENAKYNNNNKILQHTGQYTYNFSIDNVDQTFSKNGWPLRNDIVVQLVNKFLFSSIEECLNSFDFDNCKYAIVKEKNNVYYLHYDSNALLYDSQNILNICHSNSPFLAQRIRKYYQKGLAINNTKSCNKIILDYYYKCISKEWVDKFKISENFLENSIKLLDEIKNMSAFELSLFIGKFNKLLFVSNYNSYGIYCTSTSEKVDWATHKIGML